jgi:hypothetical protein
METSVIFICKKLLLCFNIKKNRCMKKINILSKDGKDIIIFANKVFLNFFQKDVENILLKEIEESGFEIYGSRNNEKLFLVDTKSKKADWVIVKRV